MRIESGPTGERRVRTLLLLLMITVFAVWFAYDGWIGYPAKNRADHLQQLPPEEREAAGELRINPLVTEERLEEARQALAKAKAAERKEALEAIYAGPPSYTNADSWFYFGPAMGIKIELQGGVPTQLVKLKTRKSPTDIIGQRLLAVFLGVSAILVLLLVARVLKTHLVLDEAGLSYRGKGPIGWDDMKRLDCGRFAKKGWVDLIFVEQGVECSLRLDEYHLAKFDEVIDAICARKSFENPLPVESAKPESPVQGS